MQVHTKLIVAFLFLSVGLLHLNACKNSVNDGLEESLSLFTDLEQVEGAANTTITINRGEQVGMNAAFQIEVNEVGNNPFITSGIHEGWCIEWKKGLRSNDEVHEGVKMYSTRGSDKWKPLHYFFSIKPQIEASDSTFSYREAQAVIWSIAGYMEVAPEFDLDKLQNEELPGTLMRDGEPNFNKQKVKAIVSRVKREYSAASIASALDGGIVAATAGDEQDIYIPVEPSRIEVQPNPATVLVSETVTMTATVYDEENNELTDVVISWSIEDESIASINQDGLVTGLSAGETIVNATSDGVNGSAMLVVEEEEPVPTSITFELDLVELTVSEAVELSVTILDAEGNPISDVPITWSTLDESIATVDESGILTGVNPGETEVVAEVEESAAKQLADASRSKMLLSSSIPVIVEAAPSEAPEIVPETISASNQYSCALDTNGNAYCWGYNSFGQLGDGTTVNRSKPTPVIMPPGTRFTSISTGREHTTAISSDGKVYAWGRNNYGQIGDGTVGNNIERFIPTSVSLPESEVFQSVSSGDTYTVALTTTGILYAWGRNFNGATLGIGNNDLYKETPVEVIMPAGVEFIQISASPYGGHTLALASDGTVWAWGINSDGQLGDGTFTNRDVPVPVSMPEGIAFESVDSYHRHSVALSSSGDAWTWGANFRGQLGIGTEGTGTESSIPVIVEMPTGIKFSAIEAGLTNTMALSIDGKAYGWGGNFYGMIGDGSDVDRLIPTETNMPSGVTFSKISTGNHHTLALTPAGNAWSWGRNDFAGSLGNGSDSNSFVPVAVSMPEGITFE